MASTLIITQLIHDLQAKKSFVNFVWADEPGKRLGLEVPYGTVIANAERAAADAIAAFRTELAESQLSLPEKE